MKRFRYVFLPILIMVCLCVTINAADYTYTAPDGSYSLLLATQHGMWRFRNQGSNPHPCSERAES